MDMNHCLYAPGADMQGDQFVMKECPAYASVEKGHDESEYEIVDN